ncbi:alpha/beta fold hydrolase [Micromonospora sp. NPDC050276]|uniref:alpha/beta fold hydrolase n=1 Tax=Micromonospora sp. NPDC050276 TaxID=3364278 RepID=UPI00379FD510
MSTERGPAASQLQVEVGGPEDATEGSVLYVHGTLDSSGSFIRGSRKYLAQWRSLAYDRRGWGHSRRSGDPTCGLGRHVADLQDILARYQPDIVVGHSYGGLVALNALGQSPALAGALVVYEPPIRWLPWWPDLAPWEALVREADAEDPTEAVRRLRSAVLGREVTRDSGRSDADVEDGLALLAEMSDAELNTVGFEPLTFGVPTVAAAGVNSLEHDRRTTRGLAELVRHGVYIELPRATHIAHITDPEPFFGLVRRAEDLRRQADSVGSDHHLTLSNQT